MDNQFIKIGDKAVSVAELCKLLEVEHKSGLRISLGTKTPEGAFEAYAFLGNPSDHPVIDVSFCSDKGETILLSRSEQDLTEKNDDEKFPVRTFLYGRADSYVAYTEHDMRPEAELGDDVELRALVVAGGDLDIIVDLYRENQYVAYQGLLVN